MEAPPALAEEELEEDPLDSESDISTWSEGDFDDEFGIGGGATEMPQIQ